MTIDVQPAAVSDLTYIDSLQKKNAEELAFYPSQVFEREIENQRILLARVQNVEQRNFVAVWIRHRGQRVLEIYGLCL